MKAAAAAAAMRRSGFSSVSQSAPAKKGTTIMLYFDANASPAHSPAHALDFKVRGLAESSQNVKKKKVAEPASVVTSAPLEMSGGQKASKSAEASRPGVPAKRWDQSRTATASRT